MADSKKTILLIDDDIVCLSKGEAALTEYTVIAADSGLRALNILERKIPDIILLDIEMPNMDGYEVLRQIKANPNTARIPVVYLTDLTDETNEFQGLALGAADYITKPFNEKILKKRIETHLLLAEHTHHLEELVARKAEKITRLKDGILSAVAEMVEFRDSNTGGHIERTQCYLRLLVEKMLERGLYTETISAWDMELVVQSSQLHDVGKINIPDSVLNKTAKLTDEEFAVMKTHTLRGKEAIMRITEKVDESELLHQAELMAHTHHERWDGKGYPRGLKGEEIPLQGRLMAIADVYDALISERPYKKAFTHEEAVKIISEGRGTQFDPLLIDLFIEIEKDFQAICRGNK